MFASTGSRRFFAKSFRYGSSICQARCTRPSNQYVPPSLLHEPFSSLPQLRLTPRGFQSADHARRKWWLTPSMWPVYPSRAARARSRIQPFGRIAPSGARVKALRRFSGPSTRGDVSPASFTSSKRRLRNGRCGLSSKIDGSRTFPRTWRKVMPSNTLFVANL